MDRSSQQKDVGDETGTPSDADLSSRRERLNRVLDEKRQDEIRVETKRSASSTAGYAQAMKLSSEFISGIVVGGGIGWLLDQWVGTTPFGLIVFLLLGFGAGVLNVLRAAGAVAQPEARIRRNSKEDQE